MLCSRLRKVENVPGSNPRTFPGPSFSFGDLESRVQKQRTGTGDIGR